MNFYKIKKYENEQELIHQVNELREDILHNTKNSYCELCGIFTKNIKVVVLDDKVRYLPSLSEGYYHAIAFFLCDVCHSMINQDIIDRLIVRNYQ